MWDLIVSISDLCTLTYFEISKTQHIINSNYAWCSDLNQLVSCTTMHVHEKFGIYMLFLNGLANMFHHMNYKNMYTFQDDKTMTLVYKMYLAQFIIH